MERWRPWTWPSWDAVSTLAVTAVLVGAAYGEAHPINPRDQVANGHPVPHTPPEAFLLVAIACLVLAWRHRRPIPVLAISTAAVVAYTALGFVNGAALVAPAIAVYAMAVRVPVRTALVTAGITVMVLMGVTGLTNPFGVTGGGFDVIPALIAAPCFGGIAVANRRAYVASIRTSAEQEARARVGEERLRIARELHDVVAHTMSTINVQAGVAAHLLADRSDDPTRETLLAIRDVSKQGLRELRAILEVLRRADEADPTHPAPGTAQLAALVDGARAAGLPTDLHISGTARPLPPAVDLAAYRIVQESITNAIRYARPATATVRVGYQETGVRLEVTDTGSGTTVPAGSGGSGHGLIGMRERAASVGGTVEAGPRPDGGWRVTAWLPAGVPPATPALAHPAASPARS